MSRIYTKEPTTTKTKADLIDEWAAKTQAESESDIATLLSSTLKILGREVGALDYASRKGKLDKASATDLVSYIKLLGELHNKEKDLLADLSDAELTEMMTNAKAKSSSGS